MLKKQIKKMFCMWAWQQCLYCGWWIEKPKILCDFCQRKIEPWQIYKKLDVILPFTVRYLYYWSPGASCILSVLLLFLKTSQGCRQWQLLFYLWMHKHSNEIKKFEQILILPAPGRKSRDHAYYWAECISKNLQVPMCSVFHKTVLQKQQKLTRLERSTLQVEVDTESLVQAIKSNNLLIVMADDVLTTGSTAQKCYAALKTKIKFPFTYEVWVLAHRGL